MVIYNTTSSLKVFCPKDISTLSTVFSFFSTCCICTRSLPYTFFVFFFLSFPVPFLYIPFQTLLLISLPSLNSPFLPKCLLSTVDPFYYTKYFSCPLIIFLFRIFSTLCSFSPSITTGGGGSLFYCSTCSLYFHTQLTFTTGWVLSCSGYYHEFAIPTHLTVCV